MDDFGNAEVNEARKFGEFYIDLFDKHKATLMYYLADTAVLDWFGHTVKDSKNIDSFIKHKINHHQQHFKPTKPVKKIGCRDTHVIKFPSKLKVEEAVVHTVNEVTPPKRSLSVATSFVEQGQGDGSKICDLIQSPVKRLKLDVEAQGDTSTSQSQMKYVATEGSIEFRKTSSKKLQPQTRWSRPCKLEIAYCGDRDDNYTIYMIIYQNTMKCRKNLLKEFESCASND